MWESVSGWKDSLHLENQWIVALYVFLGTIGVLVLKSWYDGRKLTKLLKEANQVGGYAPSPRILDGIGMSRHSC